jgi:ATP synthase protein I
MDPLEKLKEKLDNQQNKNTPNTKEEPGKAIYIATEIVAGTCVGGIIGYYLDQYLHTKVLFLLIFLNLGLISSLYNIYKKYK